VPIKIIRSLVDDFCWSKRHSGSTKGQLVHGWCSLRSSKLVVNFSFPEVDKPNFAANRNTI